MYADDHQIYHNGRDQSSVMLMLKESAQQATNWYNSNLLAGNLKKYQTMNIGHGQSENNTTRVIRLNNHDSSITDSLKLLGVTIDSKLNFSEHINMICKIAVRKLASLWDLETWFRQMLNLCFLKRQYCRTLHIATLCGTFAEPVILVKSSGCKKGACVLFLETMLATLNF